MIESRDTLASLVWDDLGRIPRRGVAFGFAYVIRANGDVLMTRVRATLPINGRGRARMRDVHEHEVNPDVRVTFTPPLTSRRIGCVRAPVFTREGMYRASRSTACANTLPTHEDSHTCDKVTNTHAPTFVRDATARRAHFDEHARFIASRPARKHNGFDSPGDRARRITRLERASFRTDGRKISGTFTR